MSTWWDFECMDHEPPIRSQDEFTQHTDDAAFKRGLELLAARPVERNIPRNVDTVSDYFERNARGFLADHPRCRIELVSEYGERRRAPDWGKAVWDGGRAETAETDGTAGA